MWDTLSVRGMQEQQGESRSYSRIQQDCGVSLAWLEIFRGQSAARDQTALKSFLLPFQQSNAYHMKLIKHTSKHWMGKKRWFLNVLPTNNLEEKQMELFYKFLIEHVEVTTLFLNDTNVYSNILNCKMIRKQCFKQI